MVQAFQNLLSNSRDWGPSINDLPFNVLGAHNASMLKELFLEEEVFFTLCGP